MKNQTAGASGLQVFSARDLRKQDKIRQITRAATDVFLEEGFTAASMDKIVEKAGVSKRTLYNYYESKEEIFIDVMQIRLGEIWENFEPDRSKSEDWKEHLRRVGIEYLRIINTPETLSLFRIAVGESQRFPKLARLFVENFEKLIDSFAAILGSASSHSDIRVTEPKEASEYFLDVLTGTAYQRIVFGLKPPMNDRTIEARTERALNYFISTIT